MSADALSFLENAELANANEGKREDTSTVPHSNIKNAICTSDSIGRLVDTECHALQRRCHARADTVGQHLSHL